MHSKFALPLFSSCLQRASLLRVVCASATLFLSLFQQSLGATLEEALDLAGFTLTPNEAEPWFAQTAVSHDGVDAAEATVNGYGSPKIMDLAVKGPGTVSFRWKYITTWGPDHDVDYGSGLFSMVLDTNGVEQADPRRVPGGWGGVVDGWTWETLTLGPGTNIVRWELHGFFYDGSEAPCTAWVDEVYVAVAGRETAPFITCPPQPLTAPAGGNRWLAVAAAGYPVPELQWLYNGVPIPAATNAYLVITNVQPADSGAYSIVASNELGSLTNTALVTITNQAGLLLEEPISTTAAPGTKVTFTARATGTTPFFYQWRFNGSDLPGETNDTLTFQARDTNQTGLYSVAVSNSVGVTVSRHATFGVVPFAAWGSFWGHEEIPPWLADVAAVSGDRSCGLALRNNGRLVSWDCSGATTSPPVSNLVAIAGAGFSAAGLRNDGVVVQWDDNGTTSSNGTDIVSIAAGISHVAALRSNGTVLAWGRNTSSGQTNVPSGLSNVVAIAAGANHTIALKSDGSLAVWGYDITQVTPPAEATNVIAVSANGMHSLALRRDGTLIGWPTPAPPDVTNVVAIAGCGGQGMALLRDRTLRVWNTGPYYGSPMPEGLTNVVAIACNDSQFMALVANPNLPPTPKLLDPVRAAGSFQVTVPTLEGKHYTLQFKNSLADTDWTSLNTVRGYGYGLLRSLTDPQPTPPTRFYRISATE